MFFYLICNSVGCGIISINFSRWAGLAVFLISNSILLAVWDTYNEVKKLNKKKTGE